MPYGYYYNSKGRLIPNIREYKVVLLIISLRKKKYTFECIVNELNLLNIPYKGRINNWITKTVVDIYYRERNF